MEKPHAADIRSDPPKSTLSQHAGSNFDTLYREPQRRVITSVSRSSWYALMDEGKAPKPVKTGRRSVAWRASDLQAWIESRPQQGAAQ